MYKKHGGFETPKQTSAKIWRYQDFTKLVSLFETGSLYFSRADKFIDQFEGSVSKATSEQRASVMGGPLKSIKDFKKLREHTYINSWHLNEHESAAMWDLYINSYEGIAIQSTFERLTECFNKNSSGDVCVGKVKYIDYQSDIMKEGDTLYPFVHKRRSFEHEKEVRAVIQNDSKQSDSAGFFVPVDAKVLIEKIYISPTAPDWFFELVKSVMKKYGHNYEIIKSNLTDDPIF